jgi:hypothetical protein
MTAVARSTPRLTNVCRRIDTPPVSIGYGECFQSTSTCDAIVSKWGMIDGTGLCSGAGPPPLATRAGERSPYTPTAAAEITLSPRRWLAMSGNSKRLYLRGGVKQSIKYCTHTVRCMDLASEPNQLGRRLCTFGSTGRYSCT